MNFSSEQAQQRVSEIDIDAFGRVTVSNEFYDFGLSSNVVCITYTPHNNSGWGIGKHVPVGVVLDADFIEAFKTTAAGMI